MKPTDLRVFPERLRAIAIVHGEEIAWEQKDCASAIEWLRDAGYALLGTELWIIKDGRIQTAIHTDSGSELYVTSCDPLKGETWRNYVERSAHNAGKWISAFRWPANSVEPPHSVYFNLSWADADWFRAKGEYDAYFVDE